MCVCVCVLSLSCDMLLHVKRALSVCSSVVNERRLSPAEMDEAIEVPFDCHSLRSTRNHV